MFKVTVYGTIIESRKFGCRILAERYADTMRRRMRGRRVEIEAL